MRYLSILLVLMVTVLAMLPGIAAADPPSQHGNACDDSDEINGWAFVISGKGNGVYSIDFVSESGDIPITNWDLRTVHDTAELGSPSSVFSAMINNPTFSGVYTPVVACDHSRSAYSDSPPIYALPSAHIGTVTFTVDPGAAQDGSDDFYWDMTQGGAGHQTEGLLSAAVLAANGHLIVWCGDVGQAIEDEDKDGHPADDDCDDNDANVWQLLPGYLDTDGDGFGTGDLQQICSGNTLPTGYATVTGDNCPLVSNPDQADADGDGIGDACDACQDVDKDSVCADLDCNDSNPDIWQLLPGYLDADLDGFGSGTVQQVCSGSSLPSGYASVDGDNCPTIFNPDQADTDDDSIGDVCDDCPNDPNNDSDGDGVCGDIDNCPLVSNPVQEDTDIDGIGDACDDCTDSDQDTICDSSDQCPNDAEDADGFNDTDGCPDPDNDADSIPDITDQCPNDAEDIDGFEDADGCPDPDNDGDGIADASDNCPLVSNPGQENNDGDALGDVCDPDDDEDGVPDASDNCPLVSNPSQEDTDTDGIGDACDTEECDGKDNDGDGSIDEGVKSTFYRDSDNDTFGDPAVSTEACSQPSGYVSDNTDCNDASASVNPGMTEVPCNGIDDDCSPATLDSPPDADGDGVTVCNGDCNDSDNAVYPGAPDICNGVDDDCDAETDEGGVCDPIDADADGYPANVDCNDNDPTINPAAQEVCDGVDNDCDAKTDEDGVCPIDRDGDGIADNQDNCPNTSNPGQSDRDGDGKGDACDTCPQDPTNQCGGGSIPGMTAWGALAGVMVLAVLAVWMLKRKQAHLIR